MFGEAETTQPDDFFRIWERFFALYRKTATDNRRLFRPDTGGTDKALTNKLKGKVNNNSKQQAANNILKMGERGLMDELIKKARNGGL